MPDEVSVQRARPADPTLEKRKLQLREAPRYSAHEERPARRLSGCSEVPDVVVHGVRYRGTRVPTHPDCMEGWAHAELHALGPDGIVIVCAVKPEGVEPIAGRIVRAVADADAVADAAIGGEPAFEVLDVAPQDQPAGT